MVMRDAEVGKKLAQEGHTRFVENSMSHVCRDMYICFISFPSIGLECFGSIDHMQFTLLLPPTV